MRKYLVTYFKILWAKVKEPVIGFLFFVLASSWAPILHHYVNNFSNKPKSDLFFVIPMDMFVGWIGFNIVKGIIKFITWIIKDIYEDVSKFFKRIDHDTKIVLGQAKPVRKRSKREKSVVIERPNNKKSKVIKISKNKQLVDAQKSRLDEIDIA